MGLVVGIIFVSSNIIFAQDDDAVGGIIYGDNWACLVKAPNGWVMDQKSLAHNNILPYFMKTERNLTAIHQLSI
ncbi:MAG: hypothetical protein LBV69_03885 [Bacteroidales bacterium]|nr:hypothetical protein [Bacteroidales bacterium]